MKTSKQVFIEIIRRSSYFQLANIKPSNERIFCRKVNLNKGGYTSAGLYFGLGNPLYVEYTKNLEYVKFFRKINKPVCNPTKDAHRLITESI